MRSVPSSPASALSRSWRRPAATTRCPSVMNFLAIAAPNPALAPVTNTVIDMPQYGCELCSGNPPSPSLRRGKLRLLISGEKPHDDGPDRRSDLRDPVVARWEGSRPRPAVAGSFPKPAAFPCTKTKYTVGFENAFTARGDPTSASATTNGRKTTGYVGQAARPPRQGFLDRLCHVGSEAVPE